jgi:hypothetical protein
MTVLGCGETDAGITTAVKTRLAADETVKAYQVDVDTREGVVTLNGTVPTAAARERAMQLARETDGVRGVVDNLRVGEAVPTTGVVGDADIDTDIDDRAGAEAREGAARAKDGAREGAEAVGDAARKAGQATKRGAEAVADGASRVGSEVRDAVTDDDEDDK